MGAPHPWTRRHTRKRRCVCVRGAHFDCRGVGSWGVPMETGNIWGNSPQHVENTQNAHKTPQSTPSSRRPQPLDDHYTTPKRESQSAKRRAPAPRSISKIRRPARCIRRFVDLSIVVFSFSFKLSNSRTVGLSDSQTLRVLDCQTLKFSDSLTLVHPNSQTLGLSDFRTQSLRLSNSQRYKKSM